MFQDPHHYKTTHFVQQPLNKVKTKDTMKQMQAQEQGITLITIPFWWDRTPQR
jgi:hypothetical protein